MQWGREGVAGGGKCEKWAWNWCSFGSNIRKKKCSVGFLVWSHFGGKSSLEVVDDGRTWRHKMRGVAVANRPSVPFAGTARWTMSRGSVAPPLSRSPKPASARSGSCERAARGGTALRHTGWYRRRAVFRVALAAMKKTNAKTPSDELNPHQNKMYSQGKMYVLLI